MNAVDLKTLPGGDLVSKGLSDLIAGEQSEHALLVLAASPRLRRLGIAPIDAPNISRPREHALYEALERKYGAGAYSRYNSLLRRMASFCHALEQIRSQEPNLHS